MHALPAAPAPAPQRQMLVGTSLAVVAMVMLTGGMLADLGAPAHARRSTPAGTWLPDGVHDPRGARPTSCCIAFVGDLRVRPVGGLERQAQRPTPHRARARVHRRSSRSLVINAQAFVYAEMGSPSATAPTPSMFYAITGMFVVLMIIGMLFTVVAAFRYLGGRSGDQEILVAHAIYWYAMSAIYAAIWFVVYVTK